MIDYNLYDKELNNWIDNEKIAANLLNLTGQLMYDKGIEIVLFRQNILDVGVTELMRLVAYAENVVERKIDLKTALALTQVISDLELPPSKLDLGLLTAEYLEEKPENHKTFIKAKLKVINDQVMILPGEHTEGISPGQAAVIYNIKNSNHVLGGGWIEETKSNFKANYKNSFSAA